MMIRVLFLFLFFASVALRGSEPISVPFEGASASVKQPHVIAEMIPETSTVESGQPFGIILHLHSDPGWHTYWINPGDAGLATKIKWTLPEGFSAGPIQWPTPEKHKMRPLVTYGYEGDVYLLTTITPPSGDLPKHFDIKARASWLVCQEECIPGKGDFTLSFDTGSLNLRLPIDNKDFFAQARMRLPLDNKGWNVSGLYGKSPAGKESLEVMIKNKWGHPETDLGDLQFFPEQANVTDAQAAPLVELSSPTPDQFIFWLALMQNGQKPDQISGVLVSSVALASEKTGDSHAIYISAFPVAEAGATAPPLGTAAATSEKADDGSFGFAQDRLRPPLQGEAATVAQPLLIAVLGAAFIGGLILNLMPCVLPVLSLKVFSLMKHGGDDPRGAWKQGVAFTTGVVISFWALAGLLLVLKSASHQLGWGFQMQSPGFVLFLIYLFFLLGLNLLGVFELGASLVGVDAKATSHSSGLTASFLNGALATLAATPCTAPFMGSAVGFAAQQPAFISLLVFTFVALGMAAPYLLLTLFPAALRLVPKPGAWMETFKQFMGFLLLATVIWLVNVFAALVGQDANFSLLYVLLLAAGAAWLYGKWQRESQLGQGHLRTIVCSLFFLGVSIHYGVAMTEWKPTPEMNEAARTELNGWKAWSQDAVQKELADGHPVFVDFTAAWCLSCKVNERVALDADSVRQAFKDKNVVLFKADWTHNDPEISKALQQYNRDGVPLYLLYSPKQPTKPQVLPEVLTPGIVLAALGKL